ncbi:flavin reductase family protein [Confluentibacter flavum]|uniref:Flavin oxidoreductase n=1 Tax=Confluentibacter flavum TaxID=1909700 RepID=A0A2N3HMK4_9FLAO|nr:flavin reductase [Confluentibacter flavum]PKQ46209.1 flavin oxidoreductase [Confluentibacter flavum]
MAYFSNKDISELNHFYKINLINSCSGYKSANLIGTKSANGISNVAIFSSVIHLGSEPALLGFILRPATVTRNTYENIKETGVYTINHVHQAIIEDAHHTSAKYESSISEFDMTALEEAYLNNLYAPYVKNAPVQIAMNYVEEYPIKENGTILLVGEIQHLNINDHLLKDDGFVNLLEANVVAINGLDSYTVPMSHTRLAYQRPKKSS